MSTVLDTGALTAIDKHDRAVGTTLRVLKAEGKSVHTSASAVAQAWRDGRTQANLAWALCGLDVVVLDELGAKAVGALLRESGTDDLLGAHVALLVQPGGQVLTSDEPDIKALLRTRLVMATVIHV